ncbi:MAG: hypothetical protein P0Y53_16705 [Candidatus Pseudobacter hemicellulosilyticus]|uniref:Uncharacterized protein n=1 Tax=Candidatus Pseudobacter hemicellulosilyticus TaxID=3121375 RepID=A0AAJ6BE15_9BACT|nr:MAG: hypothetical protein P0Y53_16705 [Pseudobacter sp.]
MENINEIIREVVHSQKTMLAVISNGFTKIDHNFKTIQEQVDALNIKVDFLHAQLEELKGSTSTGLGVVGIKIEGLTEEIAKINFVTQYGQQFDNLQGLSN